MGVRLTFSGIFDSNIERHFGLNAFHPTNNFEGFRTYLFVKLFPKYLPILDDVLYFTSIITAKVSCAFTSIQKHKHIISRVQKYVEWWGGVSRFSMSTDSSWHAAARTCKPPKIQVSGTRLVS